MTLGLDGWLKELADKKIPVLKHRREQMLDFLQNEEQRSLSECAPILLSDPLMTANLFRCMNQQRVKDNRLAVTTVSSLLSLFGAPKLVQEIKAMECIEDLGLPEENLRGIENCLKQGWYCTWFAMKWVTDREIKEPEEVHVAAALQSVPELMLWCYGGDAMLRINHHAYYECGVYYEEVAKVLGCNKREIGVPLAEKWALPELVGLGFETKFNAFTHATAIGLAAVLARICQHGWYGPDMVFFHEKATHYFGEEENKVAIHLHRQLLELAEEEMELGYRAVVSMLIYTDDKKYPEPEYCLKSLQQSEPEVVPEPKPKPEVATEPVVQETAVAGELDKKQFASDVDSLKQLVKDKAGFNDVLRQTVLTVHKTLKFQRVVFLMLAPDQASLVSKLSLHANADDQSLKQLVIDLKSKGLFKQIMIKPQAFCLSQRNVEKFWPMVPGAVKSVTHAESFCAVSVFSGAKSLGMIYADNNGADISVELFKAFQQITMMLNKALELMQKNK